MEFDKALILYVVYTGILGFFSWEEGVVCFCFDIGSNVVQADRNLRDSAIDNLEPLSFWPCQSSAGMTGLRHYA